MAYTFQLKSNQAAFILLWWINASDNLAAFHVICRNLTEILALLDRYTSVSLAEYRIDKWPKLLQWVADHSQEITTLIKINATKAITKKEDGTTRLTGVTSYGLYSLLYHSHENPVNRERYFLLIGQVLLAHVKVMQEKTSRMDYEKFIVSPKKKDILCDTATLYTVELAMQRLTSEQFEAVLDKINPFLHPNEFVAHCLHVTRRSHGGYIKDVSRLDELPCYCPYEKKKKKRCTTKGYSRALTSSPFKGEPAFCIRDEVRTHLGDIEDPYDDWANQTVSWSGRMMRTPYANH